MIDPTRGDTKTTLRRLKEASYERFRLELLRNIEQLLEDFDMTWDDLARVLREKDVFVSVWGIHSGDTLHEHVGSRDLDLSELNDIAAVFSAEPYIIFRPRKPWTQS